MLTSFALGAAEGLGNAIVNKYSKDQDAEIKAKADAEREARIEEAAIRSENRAITRDDLKYNRLRTDTLADKATERAEKVSDTEYQYAHEDIKAEQQHDWHVSDMNLEASLRAKADAAKELRDFKEKNNPDSIDYKVKVQQLEAAKQSIETSKQSVEASKSSIANQEITRQISEMELKNKKEIEDIRGQLKTEGDPTRSDNLKERLLLLEGKSTAPSFHVVDKPVIDPVTGQPQLNFKREPITTKVVVAINPITKEIKEINADPTSGVKYSKEEAEKIGRAKADAEIGERTSSLFNSDKDNTKEYDNFVAARAAELVGTPKAGGMLNSKGAENPLDRESELNKLYTGKNNIGGMKKEGSDEYQPSKGAANDIKAIDRQLLLYGTGESKNVDKPLTTLRQVITTWSPPKENNTAKLIADASALLKIDPDQSVDLKDGTVRGQFIKALVKQEHGGEIKGDINKIYNYIDESWGSSPLPTNSKSNTSKKIISITQEK